MLDRNINSIIYQSYLKLGDLAYEIATNAKLGLDDTAKQKSLYNKAIAIYLYLDEIANHTEVVNNQVYRIINISVLEMNKLLSCLKEISQIYDYPVAPFLPSRNISQITVGAGSPGPPGINGISAYTVVAFASDTSGTGLSLTPSPSLPFVAFVTSTSLIPIIPATFTGRWVNYFGLNGTNGTNGAAGQSVYPYVRYATDNIGTDFSATPTPTRKYISFLFSTTDLGPTPGVGNFTTWTKYIGDDGADGADGTDGRTLHYGAGGPSNLLGNDGDAYIDTTNWIIYAPKANGLWPAGVSIIGPTGTDGSDGINGLDGVSYTPYIAWADDLNGNGFTQTFNQNKDYIAILVDVAGLTQVQADFNGLWKKYGGDGDRWATTSVTSVTIGTGIKNFVIGLNLSYSTGQRVVAARDNDEDNRMEGYVRSYDPVTGQLVIDVDTIVGSGTYNVWDVNLFGVPVQIITTDSYFGEMYVQDNTVGTPQSISTTYVKVNQFANDGPVSPGVIVSNANDNIQITVRGAYRLIADLSLSAGTAGTELVAQMFKNGSAIAGTQSRVIFENTTDIEHIAVDTVQDLNANDTIDVRIKVVSGTVNILLEEGRLSLHSTGSPSSPDFTTFENLDVDSVEEDVDTFNASLAYGVEWDIVIRKGTNRKKAKVGATWEGTNVSWDEFNVVALGTVDVVLNVDISGGNVRLRASSPTNDWIVSGNRTLIK
ncbi:MAG: hypothetical protein ACK53T_02360 [Planctomycetota bacterium]|jgi:hypothetical protein